MTTHEYLTQAAQALHAVSDAPRLDAERLLVHALGRNETAELYTHNEKPLDAKQRAEFTRIVAERATGKPLAYVLGEWEFYGRPFYVTEDVLVPRPETETLVAAALAYIRNLAGKQDRVVVADIGTGSGCIAITLALELESTLPSPASAVSFIATDISPDVLAVSTKNARRYRLEDRIEFIQGDMLRPLESAPGKYRKIDLIVSNPPYVPSAELQPQRTGSTIETAGLTFEPRMALDGGADGQRYISQIAASGIPALIEGTGGKVLRFHAE